MPDQLRYDRLWVVFPEVYRAGVFILGIVVLGVFLLVRLGFNLDWDTTLASYYFDFPCSAALILGGIIFSVRRFNFWHKYSTLDAGFILGGLALGWIALGDYKGYAYQGDYKFTKNVWVAYDAPKSFLEPMRDDQRKYVEVMAYTGQIEPISDRPSGNLRLLISIRDTDINGGARACHIIRSRRVGQAFELGGAPFGFWFGKGCGF